MKQIRFHSCSAEIVSNNNEIITVISIDSESSVDYKGCILKIELLAKRINAREIWFPFKIEDPLKSILEGKDFRKCSLGMHPQTRQTLEGYKKVL